MAGVFKRKYTAVVNGRRVKKQSRYWYIKYKDADGIERRIKGYKDKTATQQLAAQLEKEAELARAGVIDRYKEHRKKPLSEHLEDYQRSLLAKGNTTRYAQQTIRRIRTVFNNCGFTFWSDIQPSRVQQGISDLRKGPKAISAKTANYYLQSVKTFCRWMVQDRRAGENLVEHLKPLKVTSQVKRRALEVEEIRRLLEVTETQPKRYGLTGHERALVYRLAVETGLRASEIRSLKVSNFDFASGSVTLEAAYSKNRREATIPLKQSTANALKEHLANKVESATAFDLPHACSMPRMFRKDLEAAMIEPEDNGRGKLDFHSLRHTFGTFLAASGVHPKTAQDLLRHSDINLTMSRYTHTLRGQQLSAIESLPDLSPPKQKGRLAATGTYDDGPAGSETGRAKSTPQLTPKSTLMAFSAFNPVSAIGNRRDHLHNSVNDRKCLVERDLVNASQHMTADGTGEFELGRAGIEPATHGFSVRCSTD